MREPIQFRAGSSDEITIPLTDGDGGAISDWSGWSAKAQLMLESGGEVLHEWDTADASIVLSGGGAVLKPPAESVSLAWTFRYAWLDLRTVDPDSKPSRPYQGGFEVIPAYTT